MNSKENRKADNKYKFRIFARASDYLVADIWARDEEEANRIAPEHDGGDYRTVAGSWQIEEIRKVTEEDLAFESFQPLN